MLETTMRHVVGRLVRGLGVALFMVAAIGSCKVPFGELNNPVDPESDVYMGAPSDLAASVVSSTRVDLSWVDNAKSETGFTIERKTGAAGTYAEVATIAANVTGFSNTGLTAGVDYYYRVRAFSPDMQTGYSPEVAGSTATPTAPSGLTLTVASNTQVNLAWTDNAGNETSFRIERKTGAGGTYAQIALLGGANVATYSNAGLASGTTYYYRVRASGPTGDSAYCAEAAVTTAVPTAPSGASLTVVSSAALTLSWTDNANNETGFRIERKTGAGGTYAEIATVGPNVTSYPDTGLTVNTTYYYRVRAYNALGSSAYCTETATSTPPAIAPSGLGASVVSATRIDLVWIDNSNNETGFKIERKTGAGGTYAQITVTGANATAYSDTTVTAGFTYYYRVRATTPVGDSVYCAEVAVSFTVPAAPSGLGLTVVSSMRIDLSWTDNASNETGFKIERKTGAGGTYTQIATAAANATGYSDTTVSAGSTYYYRMRGSNLVGDSSYCSEVAISLTVPAAPSALGLTAVSSTRIDLGWTDNASNESGFKIERKTGAGGTYAQIATAVANAAGYSDATVSAAQTYYYRVRASNVVGDSSYCAEISISFTVPAAPSALGLTAVSSTRIDLVWTDNAGNEAGFKIERKTGSGGSYAQIATPAANATGYSDTTVSAGSTYYYRVRAGNAVGDSGYCSEASISFTTPTAPSALGLSAVSSTRIDLVWTENSSNETVFKIERKTGTGGTYAQIATPAANVTSYSDTTVSAGSTYYYRVRAGNIVGDSGYCVEVAISLTTPTAPSALGLAVISSTRIDLSWTDNANNESVVKIERKTGAGGTYMQIGTVSANETYYLDTSVSSGSTYYYRVRATNVFGDSSYSAEVAISLSVPVAPSGLGLTAVSSTTIDLTWTDNSGNEAGFKIERKTASGSYVQIATPAANTTTFSDTTVSPGSTYYYRVRASNGVGDSSYCSEASINFTIPGAPSALGLTSVSSTRIDLAWIDNATNESSFKIERKTGSGGTYTQIGTAAANATGYNDTTVSAGSTYYYRVRATNAVGDSGYCPENFIIFFTPDPPSGLGLSMVSATRVDLLWTDNASNETGFKIERKTGAGGTYAQIGTSTANATGYSDTTVSGGSTYYYRVRANNIVGNSGYCTEVAISLTNPAAPSGLSLVVISSTHISLGWYDNANNESEFKIERKTGSGGTYAQIATTVANAIQYTDTSISAGLTYYYRIRATNPVYGDSSYSNEVGISVTIPVAPSGLGLTAVSPTRVDLVWIDNSSTESLFKIERKTGSGGTYTLIDVIGADSTFYSDTTVGASSTYYYRIRAGNGVGDSSYCTEASVTTPLLVTFNAQGGASPSPPTKLVTLGSTYGSLATTSRSGYSFGGWWTGAGGTGSEVSSSTLVTTASAHTLYAKWVTPGSTWTERTLPSIRNWLSVTYGNGLFVAVAYDSNVAATSPDGITWTQRTLPSSRYWLSVTYGNGLFVAVAYDSNVAATSPDGITWTQRTLPSSRQWYSVTHGNGVFVAVAYNSNVAATSPDGFTWTQRTLPSSQVWLSVTFGNGVFVAVAYNSDVVATSPDGITWTQRILPSNKLWRYVNYGNWLFVVVDERNVAVTSPDGITWTQRTLPTLPSSQYWFSVVYGNGVFVAVAYNSSIATTSPDGITWTQRTLPSIRNWYSVTYGNGVFVTVASSSNIAATSP